jgi:DNA-binding GntR family transcriptional regulator
MYKSADKNERGGNSGKIMIYRTKGLTSKTYDHILKMIMNKELMPGDRIPEQKISQEKKISRTPVRDAMRQLANEGLIDILPNKSATVADYKQDTIRDIGLMRIAMESMAIKLVALYGSRADFLHLREIAQNCSDACKAGDYVMRVKYDTDFHLEFANISGNYLLKKYQEELYLRVQFILIHHPNPVGDEPKHIQEHFDIVDALIDFDVKNALRTMVNHLASFYDLRGKFDESFFETLF